MTNLSNICPTECDLNACHMRTPQVFHVSVSIYVSTSPAQAEQRSSFRALADDNPIFFARNFVWY